MRDTTTATTALRRVLLVDAAATGAMGVALAVAAGALAAPLGLPPRLLLWAGAFLVPVAAFLLWTGTHARPPRGALWLVVVGNALWVLASVALLASGRVAPTALGTAFVLAQAAAVAGFVYFEAAGLRGGATGAATVRAG